MENLIIIRTLKDLAKLKEYIQDKDFISYDVETDGVDKESHIIGFSVCADIEEAYYVVLAYWDVATQKLLYLETMEGAKDFLQALSGKSLIMQNAPFDCAMVYNNFQVELMPSVHTDTLILGHLLNENRSNGLKERGVELYGEDTRTEQNAMKESVTKNGGVLNKTLYELYKADADLIAHYGAKDAILTLKIFYHDVEILYAEGLDKFFYEDESMPLLRGPTYDLNSTGLKVDPGKLQSLKATLEAECIEAKDFILKEIAPHVKEKYPGTGKTNHFNIGAGQQLAWLLFVKLNNDFTTLTDAGKEMCKELRIPNPYTVKARKEFIQMCLDRKGEVYKQGYENAKTGKAVRPKKIGDPWQYIACGKESLQRYSDKYKWVAKLLEYKKNLKLLNTYVEGIQERMKYNIIQPSFLQHGTTSGRYSSKNPNFQNLPREDKRIKSCIVARPGKVFVGADYAQLEPRVFASLSGDIRLLKGFENGDDFYSIFGVDIFNKHGASLKKDDPGSFASLYPELRAIAKTVPLAATYGASAYRLAQATKKSSEEMEMILESYFESYPSVRKLMDDAHTEVKNTGVVYNLFGRPRRIPEGLLVNKLYKGVEHGNLPYEIRSRLNLAINHRIQSTGASIMNRAAIAFHNNCKILAQDDPNWAQVKIVMQVHDELIVEGPEALRDDMIFVLKDAMENTVVLPGVALVAEPKAANSLDKLK